LKKHVKNVIAVDTQSVNPENSEDSEYQRIRISENRKIRHSDYLIV